MLLYSQQQLPALLSPNGSRVRRLRPLAGFGRSGCVNLSTIPMTRFIQKSAIVYKTRAPFV